MQFGLSLASSPELAETVAPRAEELGYDSLWFYDSPLCYSDPFMVLALAARATSRIQLGTASIIAGMREPQVLATCVGTLNELAPGRVAIALATGFSAVGTMGRKPMKWSRVVDDMRVARALVAGQEVEAEFDHGQRLICHLHPDLGYVNVTDPVAWYGAANGPKATKIVADTADGLVMGLPPGPQTEDSLAGFARRLEELRARAAARGADEFPVVGLIGVGLRDEDEPVDSERLVRLLGPGTMTMFHGPDGVPTAEYPSPTLEHAALVVRALPLRPDAPWLDMWEGHTIYIRDAERAAITAELIEAVNTVGTAKEIRERIHAFERAGVTQVVMQAFSGMEAELERFAAEVMTPYRERSHAAAG